MRFLSGTLKGRESVWSRDKNLASHVCNCASICRAGGVPKGGCIPPVFPHARSEEGCLDFFWVDLVRTDWPPLQGPAGCTTARSFLFFIFGLHAPVKLSRDSLRATEYYGDTYLWPGQLASTRVHDSVKLRIFGLESDNRPFKRRLHQMFTESFSSQV